MKARIRYYGGARQVDRMNNDKLRTLKKALLYSYQSATIELQDGRQFRALINPNKLKVDAEDKIISIPFKDICLNKQFTGETTTQGQQVVGMKTGDTFKWIPLHQEFTQPTYWLVILQYSQETAYFRADIRQAKTEVTIGENVYHTWFKGPDQDSIIWNQKKKTEWNDLNYSRVMYITRNEQTVDFFHRFTTLKVNNETWQVQSVNRVYDDNILKVTFKEYFNNNLPDTEEPSTDDHTSEIVGDNVVYPYDTKQYSAPTTPGAQWSVSNPQIAQIKKINSDNSVDVYIKTGKSGQFVLKYGNLEKQIVIDSF